MSKHILIIEDNLDLAKLLEMHLADLGHRSTLVLDGINGLQAASESRFDLLILDIMLPGLDGLEICKRIRARDEYTPILMLTSKSSEIDRVLGLELGADDYVTKPFSIKELMARIKAILRRAENLGADKERSANEGTIQISGMRIDTQKRVVQIDDKPVELTAKEFDLLFYFAQHPGRVFSRTQLLDQVWGYGHDGYEHTVNSHINRLRAKIETDPANPRYILTVWGVGYKFNDELMV